MFEIEKVELKSRNVGVGDKVVDTLAKVFDWGQPIPTGISELDKSLGGGLRNGLTFLGGQPSIGKSTLAQEIACNISKSEQQVLYFTLDMSEDEIIIKDLSRESLRHPSSSDDTVSDIRESGLVHVDVLNEYRQKTEHLCILDGFSEEYLKKHEYGFHDDISFLTHKINEYIEAEITPVVIIDYLQLMQGVSSGTIRGDINNILRGIQLISKAYQLPILLISTIGRSYYNKPLEMESFKESGNIEYSADIALGLECADVHKDNFSMEKQRKKDIWKMELKIFKNRLGKAGQVIKLDYIPAYNAFSYKQSGIKTESWLNEEVV